MRRRSRLLVFSIVAGLGLGAGLLHALAQVIGDPLGYVSVGTAGESTSASYLAVSNGGNATAETAAVSNGGTANAPLSVSNGGGAGTGPNIYGLYYPADVAVSTTGPFCGAVALSIWGSNGCTGFESNDVAVSVFGASTGTSYLGVSGTGSAGSAGACWGDAAAISGTGQASACGIAVSGANSATSGSKAVSGLGNASACGDPTLGNEAISVAGAATACTSGGPAAPNGVAVSGTGTAASTLASVSALGAANDAGNACTDLVAVSAYGGACGSTVTLAPNGTGASQVAIDPNVDDLVPPTDIAAKLAAAQQLEPLVVASLATNAVPGTTGAAASSTTSSVPPASRHTWGLQAQQRWYWCGPGSVENALIQMGAYDAGQGTFASDMGTNSNQGTNINNMPGEINKWGWRQNHNRNPYAAQVPGSATQLMTWVTQNQTQYNGAPVIANVVTTRMPWFGGRTYYHYDLIAGYDHYGGGHLDWREEYNARQWGGNYDSFGEHWGVSLGEGYAWIHASPTHGIVW
jgi:hypothetical protein